MLDQSDHSDERMEEIAAENPKEAPAAEPQIVMSLPAAELVARRKAASETPPKIGPSPKQKSSRKGVSEKRSNPETLVVEIPWSLRGDSDPEFAASVEKWTRDMFAVTAHGAALLRESSERLKKQEVPSEGLKGEPDWSRALENRTAELTGKLEAAQARCAMLESAHALQDNTIALLKDQLVGKDRELNDLNSRLAKQHEIDIVTGRYDLLKEYKAGLHSQWDVEWEMENIEKKLMKFSNRSVEAENPYVTVEAAGECPRLDSQPISQLMPKLEGVEEATAYEAEERERHEAILRACGPQSPAFVGVRRKRKKLTSDVWNDFHHVIDIDPGNGREHRFGICKTCNRKMDADPKGKGTTYLRSHAIHCKKRKQRGRCPSCSCPSCKI